MNLKMFVAGAAVALSATMGLTAVAQAGTVFGPNLPYTSFNDTPFKGQSFGYFHLETFEDNALNTPGVTASNGAVVGPGPLVDSVDGGGDKGHSFFDINGAGGITFTFDATQLGGFLPTSVGIVWTDGDVPARHFSAYDENNLLIGTIDDAAGKFYSTGGDDHPENYRFYGATNAGGIHKIFISNDSGGIEVDHLQYGGPVTPSNSVPEPATWALMIGGFGLAGAALRRRVAVAAI